MPTAKPHRTTCNNDSRISRRHLSVVLHHFSKLNSLLHKVSRHIGAAILLLIASTMTAHAVGVGSGWGTITQLNIPADGSMVKIWFSQPIVNPAGCTGGEFYIRELDNSVASNRFLSAILTAFTAKKNVSFWIEGCTQNPWWGKTRPQLYDVYMK